MHNVRHHVQRGVVPVDELPVVPDFFRLLNRHAELLVEIIAWKQLRPMKSKRKSPDIMSGPLQPIWSRCY